MRLVPGERFASKGGYLVRVTDAQGPRFTALGDWSPGYLLKLMR